MITARNHFWYGDLMLTAQTPDAVLPPNSTVSKNKKLQLRVQPREECQRCLEIQSKRLGFPWLKIT
jgi:hypothetical protein